MEQEKEELMTSGTERSTSSRTPRCRDDIDLLPTVSKRHRIKALE